MHPNPEQSNPPHATQPVDPRLDRAFFGHPKGLQTLFFTEMWERFSFYGMKAILLLFMTTAIAQGGLGFAPSKAGPIFALYTSMVYLATVPGGWLADNFLGARRSVFTGGVFIMVGHVLLALHGMAFFYGGLALVVLGTGLLKPCISAIVGDLYSAEDTRRDAGFSIYYMGINLGAWASPLICGWLAQSETFRGKLADWGLDPANSWHWGFGAAAVGMFFGLVQYVLTGRHLGQAGLRPTPPRDEAEAQKRKRILGLGVGGVVLLGVIAAAYNSTAKTLAAPQWKLTPTDVYQIEGLVDDTALPYEGGADLDARTIRISLGATVIDPIEAAVAAGERSGTLEGLEVSAGDRTIERIHWAAKEVPRFEITGTVNEEMRVYSAGLEREAFEKELGEARSADVKAMLAAGVKSGSLEGATFKVGGLDQNVIQKAYTVLMLLIVLSLFGGLLFGGDWTRQERARLVTIFVLFVAASVFWGLFEQQGSTMTLFAERSSDNSFFGKTFPASWWQSVNAFFIIALAPVFAWVWITLGKRAPSDPAKFAFGLLFAGLAFLLLVGGVSASGGWAKASPMWLVAVYLSLTIGELFLSPVGLSSMTKLAPARIASLMMGVWFLAASVGNFLSGSAAGFYEDLPLRQLFGSFAIAAGCASFVMFLLVGPIKRMLARA